MSITTFKPMTYGLMHLIVAISVAYVLTRSWTVAIGIGLVEPFIQTFAYMLHEKVWSRVKDEKLSPPHSIRTSVLRGLSHAHY